MLKYTLGGYDDRDGMYCSLPVPKGNSGVSMAGWIIPGTTGIAISARDFWRS
jgi:hypothetical protein